MPAGDGCRRREKGHRRPAAAFDDDDKARQQHNTGGGVFVATLFSLATCACGEPSRAKSEGRVSGCVSQRFFSRRGRTDPHDETSFSKTRPCHSTPCHRRQLANFRISIDPRKRPPPLAKGSKRASKRTPLRLREKKNDERKAQPKKKMFFCSAGTILHHCTEYTVNNPTESLPPASDVGKVPSLICCFFFLKNTFRASRPAAHPPCALLPEKLHTEERFGNTRGATKM